MRVLVTGSRDWPDPNAVWLALDEVLSTVADGETLTVVHGACNRGADLEADRWARARRAETGRDIVRDPHPADWDTCTTTCPPGHRRTRFGREHCPLAGLRRNREMVASGADRCLAFLTPESRGGTHCSQRAAERGIPTTVHRSGS